MKNKRFLSLFVVISIIFTQMISCLSVSPADGKEYSNSILSIPDRHIIDGINYTGQDTNDGHSDR